MSDAIKKNTSEDLMAALMAELNLTDEAVNSNVENSGDSFELEEGTSSGEPAEVVEDDSDFGLLDLNFGGTPSKESIPEAVITKSFVSEPEIISVESDSEPVAIVSEADQLNEQFKILQAHQPESHLSVVASDSNDSSDKTVAISRTQLSTAGYVAGDRTVAVAGYSNRSTQSSEDNVKISVGQSGGSSSGYGGWGSTDSNLAQAENLKMAQSKILELERENEKLRHQNEELISASEIIRERSDLLTAQVYEYKNDREDLESSFKNEMALIKSQLNRKDNELQKAQMKIDELDSRLKFDMKKIRIRERELENRLELIRAEKNALVRSKDEQILESRRKLDQLQLEVDSYRQKCVELNRVIETNQDSFKRTTRALRLAMANLELQEENKTPLKKVD